MKSLKPKKRKAEKLTNKPTKKAKKPDEFFDLEATEGI